MDKLLYNMIFKRKSFHLFRGIQSIDFSCIKKIEEKFRTFKPLVEDIRTGIRIVPSKQTTCKRGQEYCILLYSEKKDNYLQNIGYIGEQLDLYLASLGIGALWFGIGKPDEHTYNGLDFVIMIGIAKVADDKFRKDMYKSKRKPLDEIWFVFEEHTVSYENRSHMLKLMIAPYRKLKIMKGDWLYEGIDYVQLPFENIEFDLFGGEPFLEFELLKQITKIVQHLKLQTIQ